MNSKEFVTGLYENLGVDKTAEERAHLLTHCHESIQWTVHGPFELGKCGMFKGRDGVADFFTKLDQAWEFTAPIQILDMIVTEDARAVIVTTEERGINRATKEPFIARSCHLWNLSVAGEGEEKKKLGKTFVVIGFTEWLCVYDGEGGMAKVPPIGIDVGVASEAASPAAIMPETAVKKAKKALSQTQG